ncbi:Phototropic-responsive NPH3 family protein [Salix suchowensis]|nr:Phototropic-responsive NPH3 family protein [Salix suchowensis]
MNAQPSPTRAFAVLWTSRMCLRPLAGLEAHIPSSSLQSSILDLYSFAGCRMESGQVVNKGMKVEILSEAESISGGGTKFTSGLQRQPSAAKSSCLCSPTSHAGSFRCRLHRAPSLQRTRSIDSASLRDAENNINTTADDTSNARN